MLRLKAYGLSICQTLPLYKEEGIGKTTIVKILTSLLKQDNGKAMVNRFDVALKPDSARQSISVTSPSVDLQSGRERPIR
nr:ABC-type Na+ transport system ATPase subunit NatA [Mucilaginibacter sp. X5P1]